MRETRTVMQRATLLAVVVGLTLLSARPLQASAFRVTPIRVEFDKATTSAVMTLINESSEELRFQISAARWEQQADGQMQLTPTEDIVFFPALLALKPGEERKVRVGRSVEPGVVEKTYRISFEELPALQKADAPQGSSVKIITKMSIPIFIAPESAKGSGEVTNFAAGSGKLTFDLKNGGNVHYMAQSVRVIGLDGAGKTVFDRQRQGWYVLSGSVRNYDMELSAEECAALRTVRVEAQTDLTSNPETSTLRRDFSVAADACR